MSPRKNPEEPAGNLGADDDAGSEIDVSIVRLTEPEAARLTTKIQLRLDTIADNAEKVLPLIQQARTGDAHQALGYRSWTEYVSDKFGGTLARLAKAERLPFVELLADQGMSTRAIASVVGVSKSTVAGDLSSSGHLTAEPITEEQPRENVVSISSKMPTKNIIPSIKPVTKVVGIDGKTYRPRAEPKPRRSSLPDEYRRAVVELQKSVQRLERLHSDDRFNADHENYQHHEPLLGELLGRFADLVGSYLPEHVVRQIHDATPVGPA